jgi:chemosensory pili system protein ChpA (sensor histidine kinase/response regulator)
VEQGLNAGDAAADKLEDVCDLYGDVEQVDNNEAESDNVAPEKIVVEDVELKESEMTEAVATVPLIEEKSIEQYTILSDDADEEIVEIFIEEAVEVLGELHEHVPQWKANNDDEEALAVIRRSFHTLKGSGRLLGAEMIGEFSWKFENMLNRVIDNKISVGDDFFNILDEALAVLPQLIEQLKGNREPIENIESLMMSADALSEGREVPSDAPEVQRQEVFDEIEIEDALDIGAVDDAELEIGLEEVSRDNLDIKSDESPEISTEIELSNLELESDDDVIVIDDGLSLNDEDNTEDGIYSEPEIILDSIEDTTESDSLGLDVTESVVEDLALSVDVSMVDEAVGVEDDESISVGVVTPDNDINKLGFEYDVVIDEGGNDKGEKQLDIDPMLLQIYYDESQGYVASIRQLIEESESKVQPLKAGKDLIRAFHTLYGSARTAEVDSIADLSGSAEKYVKVRQESGEEDIPEDVVEVFKEIERGISEMLSKVSDGQVPAGDKVLQDKINKIVQQEIQQQLQQSWQDSSATDELDISDNDTGNADFAIELSELSPEAQDESEAVDLDASESEQVSTGSAVEESVQVSYGDIDDELIDIFLEEADELLENCEDMLNEIKTTPNSAEHIQQLQRNMHTLKGGARMADLSPVGNLTHKLESLVVLVSENKVKTDEVLFDMLQESLDSLINMMASVRKRGPLTEQNDLNDRIDMLMRGEVQEKRSIERYDIELIDLESEDEEELEDIDISQLLPEREKSSDDVSEEVADAVSPVKKEDEDNADRPHWGERATDVNYKDSQQQVRVRSDLLNNLVDYAGEVNIYHARMGKQITDFGFNLSELSQTVVRLKEQLRNLEIETEIQIRSGYEKETDNYDAGFDPLEMDQYSTLQQLSRSLSETAADVDSINEILADITRDSETLLAQESRISTDLQEGLMRTRMVRFGGLSSRLRRIVRQVARELGKEVEVEIEGEGSEVDRTVLDRIIAPIEHILRNAVAHGIEKPEDRKAQGKNETGKITIHVDRQGTDVVINIGDDGRGIDTDKVREKAIQQGLVSEDVKLSDHDALQFILQSGFSTADEVTQVAGRGVGMDVVDSEIKQLGGVLDIGTAQGKGTDFNIRLPLTLAINQALLVSAGDDVFAVPLASIEGVVRMTGYELQRFYDSDNNLYEFNGVEFELKHLGGLLTGVQPDYSKQLQLFPVLLVRVGDQHFALHVDDMLGRREIVVKPVGLQIGAVRGIAGATILADGRVVLILEMSALVAAESLFKPHEPVEAVTKPVDDGKKTIMVVDDSITIRKITERMLKRYGIEVVLAKDGVDATSQLQDSIPDLMLLDIEMPRMDGFEVASFVRNDDRLKDIPIIMITSRTGSKHKEKAMEIGVNRYLGKPFQEDDLVSNINDILHTAF